MKPIIYMALGAFLATGMPAYAAGGTSGGTSGGASGGVSTPGNGQSATTNPKKLCKKGQVVKMVMKSGKKVATCVKASAGILPDDQLYEQGRLLAKAGEYDWALDVLAAIANQNDPHVLNYTGYSNRKAGRLELGITYYNKALAIDPNFVLAREYLGEGYVAAGRIDLAQAQLGEIKSRCGETCEEYKDLSKAIASAQ
jgi:tetratricopeptide (TPR) repeat protein